MRAHFPINMLALMIALVVVVLGAYFLQRLLPDPEKARASDRLTATEAGMLGNSPIKISEIMSSNRNTIADDKGNFSDWIEVTNYGDTAQDLTGLTLTDELDRPVYFVFPAIRLEPGQATLVFASDKRSNLLGGTMHAPFKLSSSGETVYLKDAADNMLDAVLTPALVAGQVYMRNPQTLEWEISDAPTPGKPNTPENAIVSGSTEVVPSDVYINEVMADNVSTAPDEDGEFVDWIELYNAGDSEFQLLGCALSDDSEKPDKWPFPDVSIAPGQYLIVYASDKNRNTPGANLHTNFKISAEHEDIILTDAQNRRISMVTVDNLPPDATLARDADGNYTVHQQGTPGLPNDRSGEARAQTLLAERNDLKLFMMETLASNSGEDAESPTTDWVELLNRSDQTVDLAGVGLSDDPGRARKWQFPEGAKLGAGERLVVKLSGRNKTDVEKASYETGFKLARDQGEQLTLCKPDGTIIDRIPLPPQYGDISYGRAPDRDGFFYFEKPTPGKPNGDKYYETRATAVAFSRGGGQMDAPDTLTLSAQPGATIRYTTDCSTPTANSKLYEGPIAIDKTTVIRARAYLEGQLSSTITTASYLFNAKHTFPVISVVADPDDLFSDSRGMMAMGPNAEEKFPHGSNGRGANFWMPWERPASIEYFALDGSVPIAQNVDMRLVGQFSRAENQKAFGIYARGKYGETHLNYNPFPHREFTEYKAWVLRASGQDGTSRYNNHSRMRDSLLTSLAEGTSVLYQDSLPVIVYLNGEYWGHYNLRERINRFFIAQHEGYEDPDAIDIIKGETAVLHGSFTEYRNLLEYVRSHDLNDQDALDHVLSLVDIDNYFDYVIFEMYSGNTDTGNIKFYREKKPGAKWHWILFDLDWAFNILDTNTVRRYQHPDGMGTNHNIDNTLIRAFMTVPKLREKFLTRFGELLSTNLDTQRVLDKIDAQEALLRPEMEAQFEKWGGSMTNWEKSVNYLRDYAKARPKLLVNDYIKNFYELSDKEVQKYFGDVKFVD